MSDPAPATAQPGRPGNRRTWLVIGGVVVAVLLVICVLCGAAVLWFTKSLDDRDKKLAATQREVTGAALELMFAPGTRFTGWATGPGGDRHDIDVRMTADGYMLGTLKAGGQRAEVLVAPPDTFVRAGEAFWRDQGVNDDDLKLYSSNWVKLAPNRLGIDLASYLAPGPLTERLAPGTLIEPDAASAAPKAELNGDAEHSIHVGDLTVHLSDTEPRHIVRLESRRGGHGALKLVAQGEAEFGFDVSDLTGAEVEELVRELVDKIEELRSSVDSQVRFSIDGEITLSPCTTSGCTATLSMRNTVSSQTPYLVASKPVNATVVINMTLDGRPVGNCRHSRAIKPNSTARFRCRAVYVIPRSRNPRTHFVRAVANAHATTFVEADIKRLVEDLKRKVKQRRDARDARSRPTSGPGGSTPGSRQHPCRRHSPGFADGGPGAWKAVGRNPKPDAQWPIYQEQVTGAARGREYWYQGIDFDGYLNESGGHVFVEAKGLGYESLMSDYEWRAKILARAEKQLLSQLRAIEGLPGARVRYVVAEEGALRTIMEHMKNKLPSELFKRVEWKHEPRDWRFRGC